MGGLSLNYEPCPQRTNGIENGSVNREKLMETLQLE